MSSIYIELAIYLSIVRHYLPSVVPLLAVTITNVLLILVTIWLVTIGKRYTGLGLYVDDDARLENAPGSGVTSHYYLYFIRLYFFDFFQLDHPRSNGLLDKLELSSSSEDEDVEWKGQQSNSSKERILIIELVDQERCHSTKLQLDLDLLRKYYLRKFTLKQTDGSQRCCYFIKFLFQRGRPLCNVSYLKIRQLSSDLPLHLYRVEIQDTANERDAIVCHVNGRIEQRSQCYPCLFSRQYRPPFDRAFNTTKLIWDEMMLFQLLGLDLLSLISLNLLHFYQANRKQDHVRLYWTQVLFGSALPAFVALAMAVSYRVFTKMKPQYRNSTRKVLTSVLGTVVVLLSLLCIVWAVQHSLHSHQELLALWLEAYFFSLGLYLLFCLLIVACDLAIFYRL